VPHFARARESPQGSPMLPAQQARPPKIHDEVVRLLDEFWLRSGVRAECLRCWAGEVEREQCNCGDVHSTGCCRGCHHLSPTGCVAKPICCALWVCRHIEKKFPTAPQLRERLWREAGVYSGIGYRESGWTWAVRWRSNPRWIHQLGRMKVVLIEMLAQGNRDG
jgi:hypothetical protein